jgi:type II secretory pathway component GspD/PulD (secretin)
VFRSFTLQHIPASDAERQIQNLFGLGTNPFQASMQRRAEWQRRMSRDRGGDDGDRSQAASPTPLVQNIALNMKVSALRQTNSLLVTATPAAISLIENILETIDVPGPEGDASPLANITPELRVYTVDNADEDDVAETIDAVLPGVVINEDGRNNSIHVMATPAEHDQVAELIRIINSGGAGNRVQIITLTQSDPRIMMDLLGELFRNEDRSRRPVITPGFDGRSLIVRGSSTQIAEIQKTLASFGEGGDWSNLPGGQSLANSGKLVRRLPLGSTSDAARIARAVKDILDSDNESESQIRVVFPADNNTSAPGTRVPADEVDRTDRIDRGPDDRQLVRPIVFEQPVADGVTGVPVTDESTSQPIGESAGAEAAADDNTPAGRSARVTIEVVDNELLMYSSDNEALNEVEQIIRELARQMPSRTEWTVFFLRAAPAESTAQTLVDLLNNETYGQPLLGMGPDYAMGGMSGMGGFGQPVMRIVPDARTNSLFVSGPAAQIKQAEQFLKFLDTTELPESLRDRVPRSIAVRHADVNDVAAIIRELYQDFMVDPLAAARGDRGDRRDADAARLAQVVATQAKSQGLRPVGIQLTLAVDEVANTLLVSCNDQLFEQIKQLVEQRDAAAEGSRAVIRVMQVGPGTVEQVRAALSGLSDDISVAPAPDDASSDRDRRRYDRGRR